MGNNLGNNFRILVPMELTSFMRNIRLYFAIAALTAILSNMMVLAGPAILDSAINPANGHTYYLLDNSDWTDAENAAVALGGHLATVRSIDENNWVWNRWGTNRSLWIGLYDPSIGDGSGAQHAADFVWSSGEASAYRNWNSGEPNNANTGEYWVEMQSGGVWNDAENVANAGGSQPFYGVVEIETCTPHAATATAVLYNTNFVVGATITDPGCGYTNAPLVLIQGGGGSGATATANITNGVVSNINIISTGSGYTNAPKVLIASPPFVPTVAISVSAVKVAQHMTLGGTYILQSSTNMINWTATGPAFTATNENYVNEFEINVTGQFFRLEQVD